MNYSKKYQSKNSSASFYSNPWVKLRLEDLIKEPETEVEINQAEYSATENVVLSGSRKDAVVDPQVQEKLEREFEIYADHKLKLLDQGIDLIPDGKKRRKPPTNQEKKEAFIKKRDKFLKRMSKSEDHSWGTDRYERLLEKWFPDYTLVLGNKVSEIKNTVNDSIEDFNQKISVVIETLKMGLIKGTKGDISTALKLINDSEAYLTDAVKSKDNAVMTLTGFPENQTRDFLPQYDAVLDGYWEIIQNLQANIGDLESDKSRFETLVLELSQQQDCLADFNLKIKNTSDVVELVSLQSSEFATLIESTEKIIKEANGLERTAATPDEASVQAKLNAGKAKIAELDKELVTITKGVSSVYWDKGVYYNEEVDALVIVATNYSAAHKYTETRKFEGFWFFKSEQTGSLSTLQQRDSVKKFNQMNYTYSDALIDELYIVSQNKALRDKAKAEHEIGKTFTLLVKSVQDKLFKKKPFHYGMYTKETRDKVLEYIKVHHQNEDLQSDLSTNQSASHNLTSFYTEKYFTSSQVDAINMLYDTKILFNLLYDPYGAYARFSPEQRKREIEGAIKCRNLFPTWTLQQWIHFMDTGEAPDKVIVHSPIWDVSKWPKDSKKKYYKARSYSESAGSNPWSPSWKPMFKILFALENTKNYGSLVNGRIDDYWKFEKAMEHYQSHLDDGKGFRAHIKKDNIEISFKSSYEKFLWKRSQEMMDEGKDALKTEFSRYASVTANKASAGKGMKALAAELKPVYDLIKQADTKRVEANKEPYTSTEYGNFYDTDNYKSCMSLATKYEMEAAKAFKNLISAHPMLGSIEFEIKNVSQLYKTKEEVSGYGVSRSPELTEMIRFVKATQNDKHKAAVMLYNLYKRRLLDILKLERMLKEKPERVWQLHNAIERTKAELGFDPESSYVTMIDHWKSEYNKDEDFWTVVLQIGLGLLTIIFPIIAPVTVPIIVTASTVEFSKHYDQYQFEKAASGGTYNKDDALGGPPPSVIWLVIDAVGIVLDVIDVGILAKNIARSAKEAKLLVNGRLVINKKNIGLYRTKLREYLDVKNIKSSADKDQIIAKLTDESELRRLETEEAARTNLLQEKKPSYLGEIPKHVAELFKQEHIGNVMKAGAYRLKQIDLYDFAIDYFFHADTYTKLSKLLMIAGESQELATTLSRVNKAIGSKGSNNLGLGQFLDYALGGNITHYETFFKNIETFNISQKQLDEAAEIAAKSTTPEKAAQVFYDEIVKMADTNKGLARTNLENVTAINKGTQKRMIADQIEKSSSVKELEEGLTENGKLTETSLDAGKADNLDNLVANNTELNSIPVLKKAMAAVEETGDLKAFQNNLFYLERSHQLDAKMSQAILNAAEARKGYYAAVKDFRKLFGNLNSGINPEMLDALTRMAYYKIREGVATLDQFIIHVKRVWNKTDLTSEELELVDQAWKKGKEDVDNGVTKYADEAEEVQKNGNLAESSLNTSNTGEISEALKSKILKELSPSEADDLFAELTTNSALKQAMEADEILPVAWKRINDGIPSLKTNKEYLDYLKKFSEFEKQKGGTGTVTYYRVQGGISKQHIKIDELGNVTFKQKTINISIGNLEHAKHFQQLDGRAGSKIYAFDVPKWFDDFVKESAIPQWNAGSNKFSKNAPQLGDIGTAGDSFTFPQFWSKEFAENYVKGSGKIIE